MIHAVTKEIPLDAKFVLGASEVFASVLCEPTNKYSPLKTSFAREMENFSILRLNYPPSKSNFYSHSSKFWKKKSFNLQFYTKFELINGSDAIIFAIAIES